MHKELNVSNENLSREIENYFGQGDCFLLSRGRVCLYAGLSGLALPRGTQVVMAGYTCMAVPAAVQHAGLRPVYVDIDPCTYNLNPALLADVTNQPIGAVIVQHTYGIPAAITVISEWCASREISLIEDCCHLFGTRFEGRPAGTFGAFSFMSGQWNKAFSTGLGGILLVNEPLLASRIRSNIEREAIRPSALRNAFLSAQMLAFDLLVGPVTSGLLAEVYRLLNRFGLAVGSSSQQELNGCIPEDYLGEMAPAQARRGSRELARIEQNLSHRERLTAFYERELPGIGLAPLANELSRKLPLLRYPVRVSNKRELLKKARSRGVEIGSWFETPLHPFGTRLEDYGYQLGMCPEAELASVQVINLPTHLKIDAATAEKTVRFLHKHARPVAHCKTEGSCQSGMRSLSAAGESSI